MTLAERLKQVREKLGKGQKEMARLASISYRVWQSYEANKVIPGGKVFESLSKIGINANWLLTGKGPMMIEKEEDATLSQKAVEEIKAAELEVDKLRNPVYLKNVSTIFSAIDQYTKDTHQRFTNARSGSLAAVIIALTENKTDEWKTKENYLLLINIIEMLYDNTKPLRELGMDFKAAILLTRYLHNPDYVEHPDKYFDEPSGRTGDEKSKI